MRSRAQAAALLLVTAGVMLATSCRAPTQLTVLVSTDVKCTDLRGSSITVGRLGDIEGKPVTTSTRACADTGALGSLVVVPSGDGDEVAVKVIAGVGRDVETCVPPYGKGCIVARRAIHFLSHASLAIAIPLRVACDGISCGETETCVAGSCVGAQIGDPSACTDPAGCGEAALGPAPGTGPAGGPDAGSSDAAGDAQATDAQAGDAGPPAVYNDMTTASFWSAFDTRSLQARAMSYVGAAFDGRYLYFAPADNTGAPGGLVARYDTQAVFGAGGSWALFDPLTVNAALRGYGGTAFDGRYVYFAPLSTGRVLRYDTQGAFGTVGSWSTFDASTLNVQDKGFMGAAFDGRYVYFVPANDGTNPMGVVARYDTQAAFGVGTSWSTFDVTTTNAGAKGFQGATFDGRYLYFIPNSNSSLGAADGIVARYDTQAPFGTGTSWSTFDTGTVNSKSIGFTGAVFDGRYVYLVPLVNSTGFHGVVARYDTLAAFGTAASWSTFDIATVGATAVGFAGGAFDGRYVYFASYSGGPTARYDTQAPFGTGTSWSLFTASSINVNANGAFGAAFDGKFLYLVPFSSGAVTRFDTKSPASLPSGFRGSFL